MALTHGGIFGIGADFGVCVYWRQVGLENMNRAVVIKDLGTEADWEDAFLQLSWGVLKEYCHTICLDAGIDYRRLDKVASGKLYYLTGEPGAEAFLDTLFEDLALRQRSFTGPRVLTVLGRDVTLEKTCGSIADCTFDELCGRPLGASDYLEMARLFDTVFIRHIPMLTLTLKDQARRFTTLIDNFYDKKVRVVLLAAVPLDRLFVHSGGEDERDRQLLDDLGLSGEAAERLTLFTAEEEIFAFQRTVSRLMEMQMAVDNPGSSFFGVLLWCHGAQVTGRA
ncbi:lactation elevated protein 1, partial [Lates japonicus]